MRSILTGCLFLLVTILGVNSCNGPKEIQTEATVRHFIIGHGGGFAGRYEVHRVHNDGRIEQKDGSADAYSLLKSIPQDSAISYFRSLDALELHTLEFNYPGNMTSYIEVFDGESTHVIKWGAAGHPIRSDIERFFKRMRNMIKTETR